MTAAHCLKQYSLDGDIEHVYDDITVILGEDSREISVKCCVGTYIPSRRA